jgi:glycosyltransferase involved in cell wall biosynthesis
MEMMRMDKKKILVLTEMAFRGSGYYYLMSPILQGMSKDYDIKVIGLSYNGAEHSYGFSIIPAKEVQESVAIAQAIIQMWKPDIFICGLDIPLQISIQSSLAQLGIKYIAVTPLENPPLTQSWAASLMAMDYVFFISELGKQAALKAGLTNVDHLVVGADTTTFYPATEEERNKIREDLGITDQFTILTVADNQERKNLWAEFEIISKLKKDGKKVKFILVTREHSPVGHKLRDMAMNYNLNKELVIVERGIESDQLRNLYVASDVYLSASKAEGLGIPILEAMASGLPVVGCDTGAITELLQEGRGFTIPYEYSFLDVWGNEWRHMIDRESAYKVLTSIAENNITSVCTKYALDYVKGRTFDIPVAQMIKKVEELTSG